MTGAASAAWASHPLHRVVRPPPLQRPGEGVLLTQGRELSGERPRTPPDPRQQERSLGGRRQSPTCHHRSDKCSARHLIAVSMRLRGLG